MILRTKLKEEVQPLKMIEACIRTQSNQPLDHVSFVKIKSDNELIQIKKLILDALFVQF